MADEPGHADLNASRLSLGDGCLGSQSFSETADPAAAMAAVRRAGLYGPEPPGELLAAPAWTPTGWSGRPVGWALDLRRGVLVHHLDDDGHLVETRRWAQAGRPGTQVFVGPTLDPPEPASPEPASPAPVTAQPARPGVTVLTGADGLVSALAVVDRIDGWRLTRVVASAAGADEAGVRAEAAERAEMVAARGPDALAADQEREWAARWSRCSVTIDGDPEAEIRSRFALFQLLALSDHGPELAFGARGLSGSAYAGHVFWDTEVFMLPALATVVPGAARAMLAYRLNRLDGARRVAADCGAPGARFPWESAATGIEVTPKWATTASGERIAIGTGERELHISADVVWALRTYQLWTGDEDIWADGGAEVAVEVARFWAWRLRTDPAGTGHLSGVIGPDEYHENVDDNAFTNRMVAWALTTAHRLAVDGWCPNITSAERTGWLQLAANIVTGYDAQLGRHHQFAGYDRLDPLLAESVADPPFAADLLLGADMVRRSQLIKQADVLMLHHMIPDDVPHRSLDPDIDHYLPRTSHGSSLSPAVHALVLARAGRTEEALRWFRVAAGLDLDDLTGAGAGGLHVANIGGVWQALLGGFLGLRPTPQGLVVHPNLPTEWRQVIVRCCYAGSTVQVTANHRQVEVEADAPVVFAPSGDATPSRSAGLTLRRRRNGWARR